MQWEIIGLEELACVSDYVIIHFPQTSFYRKLWKIPKELTQSFNHNRFLFNMARSGWEILSHIDALMASFQLLEVVAQKAEDSGVFSCSSTPAGRELDGNVFVWSGPLGFGPCLMQQELGRLRREISSPESVCSSGLDADPSGLQQAAEHSPRSLAKVVICFLAVMDCLNAYISDSNFPSPLC